MTRLRAALALLCSRAVAAHYGVPPCGPDEKVLTFMGGKICAKPCGGACPTAPAGSPATAGCGVCGDGGGSGGFGGDVCAGGGASCRPGTGGADCPANMSCESDGRGSGRCLPGACMLSCDEDDPRCPGGAVCSNPSGICIFRNASASAAPLLAGERDLSDYTFEHYAKEFGRSYVGEELVLRWRVFGEHMNVIRHHNSEPSKTWFLTVNEFTDRTPEEFRAARTGHRPHPPQLLKPATELFAAFPAVAASDLPAAVDWRTKPGVVTAPKNQGACGGCWAFSAAETLESHLAITTGKPAPQLSTQQLISCAPNPKHCGGTGGCQGSTQPLAFNYTEGAGITTEEDYPFVSQTGTCQPSKVKAVVKNSGFALLPVNNYTALVTAVATKGPVAISVAAGGAGWQLYGGGIMKPGPLSKGFTIDHAVQLVGYGEEKGVMYWLVRNSWGSWGEKGYIRIQRFGEGKEPCGVDSRPQDGMACGGDTKPVKYCGLCGILSSSSYPTGVEPAGIDASIVV